IEGPRDVEVVDADQLAAPAVEEDELPERAELKRAAEPRAHAPGRFGDAADLAEIARIERDEPIALPQREGPDHDGGGFAEHQDVSINPNSRRARSSRRQCRRTSTVDWRNTLMPKNAPRSPPAAGPISLNLPPPPPTSTPPPHSPPPTP